MDDKEKKHKKKKKNKHRSAPLDHNHEHPLPSLIRYHTSPPAPLVPTSNGGLLLDYAPREEEMSAASSDPFLQSELFSAQQLVCELRSVLESETANSSALRTLLEDLKTSHAASQASLQNEIQHLKEENAQLREMSQTQGEREAAMHTEVVQLKEENCQLREDNIQLVRQVEEMKDSVKQHQQEQQQLKNKMSAMQMGINQLEREAMIRTHIESQLSSDTSKGWFGWGSRKSSIAEAAALAEVSRIQMVAATDMVEKLVAENSALVEKVNEQTALIDRITRRYSYLTELQSNGHIDSVDVESKKNIPTAHQERVGQNRAEGHMIEDNYIHDRTYLLEEPTATIAIQNETQLKESQLLDEIQRAEYQATMDAVEIHHSTVAVVDEVVEGTENGYDNMRSEDDLNIEASHEITKSEIAPVAVSQTKELKPFSDAPLMGAPIRLVSFLAKYVSGADLVKVQN